MGKFIFIISCLGVLLLVLIETFPTFFDKVRSWLRSFKKLKTVDDALYLDLTWEFNAYGDQVNIYNLRSGWVDKYGNHYRCEELYEPSKNNTQIFYEGEVVDFTDRNIISSPPVINWENKDLFSPDGTAYISLPREHNNSSNINATN